MDEKDELISKLQAEVKTFTDDPVYAIFFALVRKNNELAKSLNSFTIDMKADDKSFERYMTFQKGLKDTMETYDWLRREYIKVPEDEVAELEKKGIPPIERRKKK